MKVISAKMQEAIFNNMVYTIGNTAINRGGYTLYIMVDEWLVSIVWRQTSGMLQGRFKEEVTAPWKKNGKFSW